MLFAATFAALGASNPDFRRLFWLSLAYAVGALTPASELLVRFTDLPQIFAATSFASFVLAFYVTAVALAKFYRLRPPWLLFAALLVASLALRAAIWGGRRGDLVYEFLYQLPFAVAVLMCGFTVHRARDKTPLDRLLVMMFGVTAAHFLAKPFFAHWFDLGATARAYVGSVYALFSQSGSGIWRVL